MRCRQLGWADVLVDVLPWSSRGWLALVSAGVGWAVCEHEYGFWSLPDTQECLWTPPGAILPDNLVVWSRLRRDAGLVGRACDGR